jgi:hypothetical protein
MKRKHSPGIAIKPVLEQYSREILGLTGLMALMMVMLCALIFAIQPQIDPVDSNAILADAPLFLDYSGLINRSAFVTNIPLPGIMLVLAIVIYVRRWRQ